MFSLATFGAELEREKCRQRTHDAMRRKAERKEVIGCPVYGYDAVPAEASGNGGQPRMIRQINAVESQVILRLFEQYATGTCGFVALAKQLNEEGVPPPRGHSMGWAPTCIREILRRELYRGVLVWNKTQAIVRGGKETFRKRPESEWLRVDAPELGSFRKSCGNGAAHRSREDPRSISAMPMGDSMAIHQGPIFSPATSLSASLNVACVEVRWGRCAEEGRRASQLYVPDSLQAGRAKCSNTLRINQLVLDRVLLNGITGLLDSRMLAEAVTRAAEQLRAGQGELPAQRHALEREIRQAQGRLQRLVNAIATGRATEAVFAELEKEEAKKKAFIAQLANLTTLHRWAELDSTRLEENLSRRMGNMLDLLGQHVPQARQMLRKLIYGRVICTPFDDHRGRGYELAATGTYAGLLGDLGYGHQRWRRGRDLNSRSPCEDSGFQDQSELEQAEVEEPQLPHE